MIGAKPRWKSEIDMASVRLSSNFFRHEMNLALIDPFQLAQDSPDALGNDLSKFMVVILPCFARIPAVVHYNR